jgi:hypothetical protein
LSCSARNPWLHRHRQPNRSNKRERDGKLNPRACTVAGKKRASGA